MIPYITEFICIKNFEDFLKGDVIGLFNGCFYGRKGKNEIHIAVLLKKNDYFRANKICISVDSHNTKELIYNISDFF